MDRQQQELETALADELQTNQIEISRLEGDILRVHLSSEASFDVDRADLKPPFYPSLDKISDILSRYEQTQVKVLGHTDSDGEERYNQNLSERRSETVSSYLRQEGVDGVRLSTEGLGELSPRRPNNTPENKAQNRRVEIDLIPIISNEA